MSRALPHMPGECHHLPCGWPHGGMIDDLLLWLLSSSCYDSHRYTLEFLISRCLFLIVSSLIVSRFTAVISVNRWVTYQVPFSQGRLVSMCVLALNAPFGVGKQKWGQGRYVDSVFLVSPIVLISYLFVICYATSWFASLRRQNRSPLVHIGHPLS